MQETLVKIRDNPKFKALVNKRNTYAFIMTALIMVAYYGFILLIAFDREFLAQKIGGGVTTIGIPIGVGVILFTIIVTVIYVRRANTEFDDESKTILEEAQK
ncbi:MAG: hypothetical protein H6R18_1416 [Proteobacteria bacterium]|nr:hypothetical protein [Pseudomonadota bacterium]